MTFDEWRRTQDEFCDDPACRVPWCDVQRPGWNASSARYAPLVEACGGFVDAIHQARNPEDGKSEGDFFHLTWNTDAHIEITITVADIRALVLALAAVKEEA